MFTANPETKADILSDFSTEREITATTKIAHNTIRIDFKDGGYIIRFHHTDIIDVQPKGDVVVDNGGWHTNTTKSRLNQFFPTDKLNDFKIYFFSHQYQIYCSINPTTSHTFPPRTVCLNQKICFNKTFILKIMLSPDIVM